MVEAERLAIVKVSWAPPGHGAVSMALAGTIAGL